MGLKLAGLAGIGSTGYISTLESGASIPSPVFSGTATASGTFTMPSFTEAGDITMPNAGILYWKDGIGSSKAVLAISGGYQLDLRAPGSAMSLQGSTDADIYMWGGTAGSGRTVYLMPEPATAGAQLKNSPAVARRSRYWNGAASISIDATEKLYALATTPRTWWRYLLDGVCALAIENTNGTLAIVLPDSNSSRNIAASKLMVAKVSKHHDANLFDAAALTDSATIWAQPANSIVLGCKMVLQERFAATGMTDLDVTVGQAGDNDGLAAPAAMNGTTDAVDSEYSGPGAYINTATCVSIAGQDWVGYATAVGANLSTLTAGQVDFYFTYIQL